MKAPLETSTVTKRVAFDGRRGDDIPLRRRRRRTVSALCARPFGVLRHSCACERPEAPLCHKFCGDLLADVKATVVDTFETDAKESLPAARLPRVPQNRSLGSDSASGL